MTLGRPPGSKNIDGYKMSPSAIEQRRVNAANINGKSYIVDRVTEGMELSEEDKTFLKEERVRLWKKLSSPVLLLADEYAELKSYINLKRIKDKDILGRDVLAASKILLEIAKEVNRLTQVSADKKLDVYSKSWNKESEDIVINVSEDEDNVI